MVAEVGCKLTRHNRKIALFIDNCSAHPRVQGLQSIELIFFPPNTTSEIQPCDQGIIQALKVHYRKNMVKRLITAINSGSTAANFKITLLDGLQMLSRVWESVTESTISNCFVLESTVRGYHAYMNNWTSDRPNSSS